MEAERLDVLKRFGVRIPRKYRDDIVRGIYDLHAKNIIGTEQMNKVLAYYNKRIKEFFNQPGIFRD